MSYIYTNVFIVVLFEITKVLKT